MSEINEIYERCLKGIATKAEIMLFRQWAEVKENHERAGKLLEDAFAKSEGTLDMPTASAQFIMEAILNAEKNVPTYSRPTARHIHFLRTAWFRYAAAILLVLGVAGYIFTTKQRAENPIILAEQNREPGKDKAMLTLSDGRKIILDNSNSENISDAGVFIKKANGILTYNKGLTSENKIASYNTMLTPRGGQYQLVLPDGSSVWLNSASSIKYPTIFQGKNRIVELSGEAYFDIKANKKMPFIVKTQKAEVLVMGTEFNINSYSDELEFSTTLVNGSVKVSAKDDAKTILPGQQVQLSYLHPDVLTIKKDVDINQVIAWQKGIFEFKETTLDVIARQLSRWYDIDVLVGDNNKSIRFSGGITKKTPLKGLLKMLEINGVKNKWYNNAITLYSK